MPHTLPRGLYRHYKGNLYELLHTARHSETEEPLAMFAEEVATENGSVARFALVKAFD